MTILLCIAVLWVRNWEQNLACKDDSCVGVDKDHLVVFSWQMGWSREPKTVLHVLDTQPRMTDRRDGLRWDCQPECPPRASPDGVLRVTGLTRKPRAPTDCS